MSPPWVKDLASLYGRYDAACNDALARVFVAGSQQPGSSPLKEIPVASFLLSMCSPRFETELLNWQRPLDTLPFAGSSWGSSSLTPLLTAAASASSEEQGKGEEGGHEGALNTTRAAVTETETDAYAAVPSAYAADPSMQAAKAVNITIDSEGELEAVEDCLRYLYTWTGPEGADITRLMAMYTMADYLGMTSCSEGSLLAAAALPAGDISMEDACQVLYGSVELPESGGSSRLHAACKAAIAHHLGDIVGVMRSDQLIELFYGLPLEGVVDLLGSDALVSDSEDSVLMAAHAWVRAHCQQTERDLPADEAQQLLGCIRLLQLSRTCFYQMLPALGWAHVPAQVYGHLCACALPGRPGNIAMGCLSQGDCPHQVPPAWLLKQPRPLRPGGSKSVFDFEISREQILQALTELQQQEAAGEGCKLYTGFSAQEYSHGLCAGVLLKLNRNGHLGVFTGFDALGRLPGPKSQACWRLSVKIRLRSSTDAPGVYSAASWSGATGEHLERKKGYYKLFTFPADKPITEIASWDALLLGGGALKVRVEVDAAEPLLM